MDFQLCREDRKYSIEECKERDATYAAPLKVKVRLHNKETDDFKQHDIFMGDLPLMTETGTFVINGAERVIVSQLVRSPGIYYAISHDKIGKKLYSCTVTVSYTHLADVMMANFASNLQNLATFSISAACGEKSAYVIPETSVYKTVQKKVLVKVLKNIYGRKPELSA